MIFFGPVGTLGPLVVETSSGMQTMDDMSYSSLLFNDIAKVNGYLGPWPRMLRYHFEPYMVPLED